MKIFIIRDGKQTGPYDEDAVQALLSQGSVLPKDKSWRKGLPGWLPLSEVLKPDSELAAHPPEPPGSTGREGTNGSSKNATAATAKQKALLKYLGVQSLDGVSREQAAMVISDALEDPKFQSRMNKWQEEKIRLHPDIFQDEIDFRKMNRTNRYLELCETEGTEVVKDVTKAHVQVLVESLDKRFPNWESDSRAALWDYLFPSIGEHFPNLVLPAAKGRLRLGGMPKMVSALARKPSVGLPTIPTPPPAPGAFSAALRGIVYGAIVLGLIVVADHFFGQSRFVKFFQTGPGKPVSGGPAVPPVQPAEPPLAAPPSLPPGPPAVVAKAPENPPAGLPEFPPVNPAPAPPAPAEPAPAPPAPIAPPMIAENKPPVAEKPAIPPAPVAPEVPAPAAVNPPVPELAPPPVVAPAPPVVPGAQRPVITLTQAISVTLQNGQITLPAGTQLRNLAIEGQNVRVSWNNNLFYVPAMATDVNSSTPFPVTPAAAPSTPAIRPAAPGVPPKPLAPPMARKPGDDL
jgi:hypothetical protein